MTMRGVLAGLAVVVVVAAAMVWAYENRIGKTDALKITSPPSVVESAAVLPRVEARMRRVEIIEVFPMPMTDLLVLPGSVEPLMDIDVGVNAEGLVAWIGPREGDRVRAGEPLLRLEVEALEATLDECRAQLDLAQKRYDRVAALVQKDISSRQEYDNAKAELALAQARVRAASIAVRQATVVAPVDGVLDRLPVLVGEYVHKGTAVAKVLVLDPIKVIADVSERDIRYFRVGQTADVYLRDGTDEHVQGTIAFVPMAADARSRTFPVEIRVDNPGPRLRPGMITRVALARQQVEEAIGVPFFALVDTERGKTVFVEQEGLAVARPVELGFVQNGIVQITRGLDAGDRLIVVGQRDLVNGEAVVVQADLTDAARTLAARGQDLSDLIRLQRKLPVPAAQ